MTEVDNTSKCKQDCGAAKFAKIEGVTWEAFMYVYVEMLLTEEYDAKQSYQTPQRR